VEDMNILNKYEYFLEIERQRNISKAAEFLYVSQPTLSKYLSKLESELGVTLFDRSVSPLKLTKAGALYFDFVNKYISLQNDFLSELEKFKDPYNKITIGIATWRGSMIIPYIYGHFLHKHPSYSIEFKEGPGSYTQKLLVNNKVDFCLMNVASDTISLNVDCIILDNEEVRIAINKEHPYVKEQIDSGNVITEIDLKNLENETFIMLQDNQNLTKKVYEILNYLEIKPKKIIKTSNLNTALNIVSNSHGITFYPYSSKMKHSINENLVSFKINCDKSTIPFALVYNINNEFSEACKSLINFIFSIYDLNLTFKNFYYRKTYQQF